MATRLETGTTRFNKRSDLEVVATGVIDAPRELVWDASTNPEHLPEWLYGPEGWGMTVCEVDLRPGGAWHYVWRGPDGSEMEMRGVYREVEPPQLLASTEEWGGDWPETVNTLVLTENEGLTTMTNAVLYPSKEARDNALATGMEEGWAASWKRLDEYLQAIK